MGSSPKRQLKFCPEYCDKGNGGIGGGIANEEWERFFEHTAAGLSKFPVPTQKPETIPRLLDRLSKKRQTHLSAQLSEHFPLSRTALDDHQA
jgi:hypothetical protein